MPRTQYPTRPQRRSKRRTREQKFLEQVHLNAAGIDIGSGSHWVAVPTDRDEQPVREFRSFTHALIDLADWLTACDIDTVAMESTGVYWIPLYEILEARGFTVLLVNARHVKNVPGRKSDVSDCQWIQRRQLPAHRGDHRHPDLAAPPRHPRGGGGRLYPTDAEGVDADEPPAPQRDQRRDRGHRDVDSARHCGRHDDPAVLDRHRHPQCRASEAEIAASLTGHYRDEHLFVLRQELEVYDCYHEKIRRGDEQIETRVHALQAQCEPPGRALPASRKPSPKSKRQDNTPSFEIRSPLFTLCGGVDLTALPGLGPYGALRLISEIGVDMHCWPTEHHFASWLTLAPNNRISGGKLLGSRTQPSANRAAKILRLAAMALVRGDHALGAFYRRLAARTDKPTAMTATARKLALLVYRMLKYNMPYEQTSAAEYDERQHTRILRGLRKRATSLGFELVEASTGLVG